MSRILGAFAAITIFTAAAEAQVTVAVADGGSVVTELGYNIRVNGDSSLRRSWVVLDDAEAPLGITAVGVRTSYEDRSYTLRPSGTATAREAVSAFQLRVLLFDMFGNHLKTLSGTEVTDLATSSTFDVADIGSWRAFESEVSVYLTAVTFVAYVRTADGRVWRHNEDQILARLREVQLQVSEGVLSESDTP